MQKRIPAFELILVNDGSTQNFDEAATRDFFSTYPEIKLISYSENRGKGHALREGVKAASGDIIIYTDVDFPYTTASFFKIYDTLIAGGANVVMGIRNKEYYSHLPRVRTMISKLLRFLIKRSLRIPVDDTQCGLKGFDKKGKDIFLQTTINRYLFDLEFIFTASHKDLQIKTEEVHLRDGVKLTAMKLSILLEESVNFLKVFSKSHF